MGDPKAVFFGDFKDDQVLLNELDGHLGWRVRRAVTLDALRDLHEQDEIPVVYLDLGSAQIAGKLQAIHHLVPKARVVVCYPSSAPLLADELIAVGAFHSLPKPMHIGELKQSLNLVWEARSRRFGEREVAPIRVRAAAAATDFDIS